MTDHNELISEMAEHCECSYMPEGVLKCNRCRAVTALREQARELEIQDTANDILTGQLAEARALQREYRSAQLVAENDAAMVRAVWTDVESKLRATLATQAAQIKAVQQLLKDARPYVSDFYALPARIDAVLGRR